MARKRASGARRGGKKTGIVKIDLSGVEARKLVAEDEYLVAVAAVSQEEGDKADYLKWQFKISEGKFEGQSLYYNTSLSEASLWNLRSLLEALNVEIPDEAMDLDLSEMEGLELNVTVEHETYESKKQARIVDFWSADDDAGKGKKGKKNDDDEIDLDDMDEDDLAKLIKKKKLDVDIDDLSIKKARKVVAEALEEAEEKPAGKGKKGGKKKETLTEDEVKDMDEDELTALVDEHDLDVKLSKLKTLRKMQTAVIEALTEAGVIEEE